MITMSADKQARNLSTSARNTKRSKEITPEGN